MSLVKQEARKIIDNLSENDGWDELMYNIYVRESIENGLNDIKENKILTEEQVKQRFEKWLN